MATVPLTLKKLDPKEEFVKSAGKSSVKEVKPPRRRGYKLSDDEQDYVKLLIFGPVGSGKTYLLGQLVQLGYKVAAVSTDIGDTGHLTVKTQLIRAGSRELLDNYYVIPLDGWGEVQQFLRNPYGFDPDLAAFNPDILAWDGFSGFQQVDVSEYVGDMQPAAKSDGTTRDRGDLRESGLFLEQQDWNAIRNATIRTADKFLTIRKPDGGPLHKIMTCHEAIAYKANNAAKPAEGTVVTESFKPMLSGAGGQLILGGVDLIIRTESKIRKSDSGPVREYTYITAGHQNLVAKNRGFDLKPEEPADMKYVWGKIMEGLGRGLKD